MPIYEFACESCGHVEEHLQRLSDPAPAACSKCGGKMSKIMSRNSFQLKGGGWYKDLYASSPSNSAAGSKESSGSSSTSASGDKGSAPASSSAPAPSAAPSSSSGGESAAKSTPAPAAASPKSDAKT